MSSAIAATPARTRILDAASEAFHRHGIAAVGVLLTSVCTGSWIYGVMGLLDGLPATNRKEPDRVEPGPNGKVPLDRLAEIAPACRFSRARVVVAGRIVTAGGITRGWGWASTCSGAPATPMS